MPAVKNVGEPCAGEPHARFDGGREETNVSRLRRATPGASRLPDSWVRGSVATAVRQVDAQGLMAARGWVVGDEVSSCVAG